MLGKKLGLKLAGASSSYSDRSCSFGWRSMAALDGCRRRGCVEDGKVSNWSRLFVHLCRDLPAGAGINTPNRVRPIGLSWFHVVHAVLCRFSRRRLLLVRPAGCDSDPLFWLPLAGITLSTSRAARAPAHVEYIARRSSAPWLFILSVRGCVLDEMWQFMGGCSSGLHSHIAIRFAVSRRSVSAV